VLTPGASFTRHQSLVRINQLGFRGPDINREKGERFRIVAIGESTTFGMTMLANDRTWPDVLEARIRDGYDCSTPVQVINAGVPGWSISNQLKRLPHDILPLEPDLILSYHGYNGFEIFLHPLPSVRVHAPPNPPDRPSRILETIERGVRLWWFRRRYRAARALEITDVDVDPLRSLYARHYLSLVEMGRDRGVETVLATFNMAVNEDSPEEVIHFYEALVPDVRARIVANQIHTRIVRAVGRHLDVRVIDASAGLDGAYGDAYIDIAHYSQAGRERLAANLLSGLREVLTTHPRLRCVPLAGSANPLPSRRGVVRNAG
jgi:lysophospholipase L1-like esterase